MKTRDILIIAPLLILAVTFYFLGHYQGQRAQKVTDEMHHIRMALRNLKDAKTGNDEMIKKRCTMYLIGYTRAYQSLVTDKDVPEDFRNPLAEARRVADEVAKTLVPVTKETLDK